jgi:hypothetical protein
MRQPRAHGGRRPDAVAGVREHDRLGKVVLAYIVAVAMSFGLMLSLLQNGW